MSETSAQNKKPLKKSPLGRGLGSLLGGAQEPGPSSDAKPRIPEFPSQAVPAIKEGFQRPNEQAAPALASPNETAVPRIPDHARIWQVDIAKLKGNPNQPRQTFAKEPLAELANSIREKGILQPIVARKLEGGSFQIIAGERRWRAAQLAGLHQVPVILKETKDQEALELALIENIQRQDLDPIEEAEAYSHLIKTYQLTQQQLAEKIGKERVTIANTLRLLQLSPELRQWVKEAKLSMGQAKVLLSLSDPAQQLEAANQALQSQLTVRALERLVAKMLNPSIGQKAKAGDLNAQEGAISTAELIKSYAEDLQKLLKTKVQIDYRSGKGQISIHFYSDEEFSQLVDQLKSNRPT